MSCASSWERPACQATKSARSQLAGASRTEDAGHRVGEAGEEVHVNLEPAYRHAGNACALVSGRGQAWLSSMHGIG